MDWHPYKLNVRVIFFPNIVAIIFLNNGAFIYIGADLVVILFPQIVQMEFDIFGNNVQNSLFLESYEAPN